ncbi:helix-turn-helix transcriptional regulator [Hymenobacter bucti]|uniref:Helix-turn-helix transcriptional regulator n=1 Tax=Hymenobacter bucti TaxID=1844114 RepID=A0ABW4QMW5_9BACT
MIGLQTLADFYADRVPLLQPGTARGGADFSAWRLEDFLTDMALVGVYSRKDFYKITLTTGPATYRCADQRLALAPGEQAMVCTNTQVPYTWEVPPDGACRGYCCVFTEGFLPAHTHLRPADWAVFAPDKPAFFRLTAAQAAAFGALFEKMLAEQASAYPYKYELLYHYLMECIHGALKLAPVAEPHGATAATRLAAAFGTLLASQYPIITPARRLALRTPQAFAEALAVHVNYLNRVLKAATGKTTTQLLAERLVQEARTLLLHTDWPIGHISHCLGFEEPTHFTQLFRKYAHCTPSSLRRV